MFSRGGKLPPSCERCFPRGGKLPPRAADCRPVAKAAVHGWQAAVHVRQAAVGIRKLPVASGRQPALSGRLTPARNRPPVADVMHPASALAPLPSRRDLRETENVSPRSGLA